MFKLFSKRPIFILFALSTVLVGIVILFSILSFFSPEESEPRLLQVTGANPLSSIPLQPGTMQSFEVTFSENISPENFAVTLSKHPFDSQAIELVPVNKEQGGQANQLIIEPLSPIEPFTNYTVAIRERKTNALVFEQTYTSVDVQPTRARSNNQALKAYLPYETSTYKLSYIEELNTYVFNLKLNPNSPDTYNEQYLKARREAEAFIESKGIALDSLVIEWKRY